MLTQKSFQTERTARHVLAVVRRNKKKYGECAQAQSRRDRSIADRPKLVSGGAAGDEALMRGGGGRGAVFVLVLLRQCVLVGVLQLIVDGFHEDVDAKDGGSGAKTGEHLAQVVLLAQPRMLAPCLMFLRKHDVESGRDGDGEIRKSTT